MPASTTSRTEPSYVMPAKCANIISTLLIWTQAAPLLSYQHRVHHVTNYQAGEGLMTAESLPTDEACAVQYVDRQTGHVHRETVLGEGAIRWAYQSLSGQVCSPLLFGSSVLSRMAGWYCNSRWSQKKIARTIEDLGIDPSEFAQAADSYRNFNDFFTRRLKAEARPYSNESQDLISPADGRILVYTNCDDQSAVKVKGVAGPLTTLLGRPLNQFVGGDVVVVRLCPADYHRYHFPFTAQVTDRYRLKGAYHSVNPLALDLKPNLFCRNKRAVTLLKSDEFGQVAFIEVGAFGVAGIHDTYQGNTVARMDEKGYFDFGGSTVVLVFEPGRIDFDDDLLANSERGMETLVKVGEHIGQARSDNSATAQ